MIESWEVQVGEPLVLIGQPWGLPTKVSHNAEVLKNDGLTWFMANLDSFEGNSGGPVFNSKGDFVEGILVGGEEDYVWSDRRECFKAKRCFNLGCDGEEITRITSVDALKDLLDY